MIILIFREGVFLRGCLCLQPTLTVLIHGRPATFGGSPNAKWAGGSNAVLDQGKGGHTLLSIWRNHTKQPLPHLPAMDVPERLLVVIAGPGEQGDEAVADIILGVAQPGGRLAQPWPRSVGYVHSRASARNLPRYS